MPAPRALKQRRLGNEGRRSTTNRRSTSDPSHAPNNPATISTGARTAAAQAVDGSTPWRAADDTAKGRHPEARQRKHVVQRRGRDDERRDARRRAVARIPQRQQRGNDDRRRHRGHHKAQEARPPAGKSKTNGRDAINATTPASTRGQGTAARRAAAHLRRFSAAASRPRPALAK